VAAQQAWIDRHLPGARPAPPPKTDTGDEIVSFGQEVIQHGGKLYSVVHLVMPDSGKLRGQCLTIDYWAEERALACRES